LIEIAPPRQLKRYTLSFFERGLNLMRQLLLTTLALGCLMVIPSRANACFCITPDVPDALKQAKTVFLGEVIDIVEPKTTDVTAPLPGRFFTIKFKIQKSWKGIASGTSEFSVLSAQGRYGCFAFRPVAKGERYLVYADPASDTGHWGLVTICNRTTAVRLGFNPDAIDPYEDMKQLDIITKRAFSFASARSRRRV